MAFATVVVAFQILNQISYPSHGILVDGQSLMIFYVLLIGVCVVCLLSSHFDREKTYDELCRPHEFWVYLRINGVARLTNLHVHTHHRGQRRYAA